MSEAWKAGIVVVFALGIALVGMYLLCCALFVVTGGL